MNDNITKMVIIMRRIAATSFLYLTIKGSGSDQDAVWARLVCKAERLLEVVTSALVGWEQAGLRSVISAVTHVTQDVYHLQHQHNTAHLADDLQVS